MYRDLLLSLCISTVLAAPQKDSTITYIKLQAESENHQSEVRQISRESRLEKLPLAASYNYSDENQKGLTTKPDQEVQLEQSNETSKEPPKYNYPDRIYSIKTKKNKKDLTESKTTQLLSVVTEGAIINLDILPAETLHTDLLTTIDNSTETFNTIQTDVTDNNGLVTEQYESEPTLRAEVDIETTKEPFVTFKPKLSYYGKSTLKSFAQNLIAVSGKRRFRSRCKCEKIWNCAKLQISVARCPDEYFLCCG
ncbi:unnamed protein product [Arctia plantaginis]|uniref:Uncharacterized protein n=1 Tax=Arctia plantaginis TaxID=874455 RepID=A0A8S0YMF8_ARCPL|nr:unnamed protein product [Arctia plantaginis]